MIGTKFNLPEMPGMKPLWVIKFHSDKQQEEGQPAVQLFLPAPNQGWMTGPTYKTAAKAIDFLQKIQQICKKINEECQEKASTDMDYLKKSKHINQDLSDLQSLIKRLNEILKWFKSNGSEGNLP